MPVTAGDRQEVLGAVSEDSRCGRSGVVRLLSVATAATLAASWSHEEAKAEGQRIQRQPAAAFAAPRPTAAAAAAATLREVQSTAGASAAQALSRNAQATSVHASSTGAPSAQLVAAAAALCGAAGGVAQASRRRRGLPGRCGGGLTSRKALQTGLVGLPNVGKSTLFNALCDRGTAEAANFPFCTIDPNTGSAKVVDKRLDALGKMYPSEKVIPEFIEYVDIAGLVKGASKGEGLGNKFLANIRNTDAIVHVVRCYEDEDVIHVDGSIDPRRDIETINLELILADMEQIEARLQKVKKNVVGKAPGAKEEDSGLRKLLAALEQGKPARVVELTEKEQEACKTLPMLTSKQVIYAANVSEEDLATGNDFVKAVQEVATETGDLAVMVSAQVEAELRGLEEAERSDYLETLGVEESGCETLVRETYKMLGLRTYFTCGPKESRAWTIRAGWAAPRAASVIHTDFEKGFIKANTIEYEKLLECGSEDKAKAEGMLRIEGKDYVVQDGDVMHFMVHTK
eukprot:TRINITY_DN867_c5_g1_i1.p1 TRINITY_DN867_c5_g1~~TRINITY_DN867_c5_g1_i1.p1  ORF type:complete len:515 (-),score=159.23 TRINITY_DN867_c5_g1_i1:305-1849(-)